MKFMPNLEIIETIGTLEQRNKLIESLRSDKYIQHKHEMTDHRDFRRACCLQVAAIEVDGIKPKDAIYNNGRSAPTPKSLKVTSKFAETLQNQPICYRYINDSKEDFYPAELNDDLMTHEQIADILEGKEVILD